MRRRLRHSIHLSLSMQILHEHALRIGSVGQWRIMTNCLYKTAHDLRESGMLSVKDRPNQAITVSIP